MNITKQVTRFRFRSCGTVGYGPTSNKKDGGIQHDHDARFAREQIVSDVGKNIGNKDSGQRESLGKALVHRR